ncbi:hypothetical protein CQW23_00218 [Capsicum baccatum]|uniref:GDSL esterase/lipase n=1 Tax=Capsicum baccatum TaxID=33114 RepID=A0A2G2XK45_CAPBA|nr:hypothetical protein CQW23_00218 [Capsicum baccatum]
MILGVDYASAGTGIIFSSSSELGQHIEQVIDTGQEFILNIGDDTTTFLSSNSVFYISLESNNCVYFYEGCCGLCEYEGWIICNSPEMACHKELVLFVIGDSSVDCRTNNFLGTFARVDRLSYGHDFDIHQPTGSYLAGSIEEMILGVNNASSGAEIIFSSGSELGQHISLAQQIEQVTDTIQEFCNGRVPVDYLGLSVSRLGLPFVPSYLGQAGSTEEMILGVNYASAGAGIIFSSGSELGQHISLAQQIVFIQGQHISLAQQIGDDATSNLISNSVFYISIGSNVYIQYYLLNVSNVQSVYLPWSFNQFLAQTIKQEIENLYNAKVRKVVVMGLAPIGWAPDYLEIYSSKNGECLVTINDMILEFNFAVRYMVSELNEVLVDASIIFCDAFEGSMDIIQNHDRYGFNVTDEACCGLGEYKGWIMCVSPEMACNNTSSHIWWDQFHPTSAVNRILADNVWSSLHTPSAPLVPALFVIGDSSVDCGTNNFLGTFARADRLPYGRDFDTHQPTGRFCNGRIPVDYLALRLGLPFVPSYLGQAGSIEEMILGVNYASAGAGIIFSSGSELGQHISLAQQIEQVTDTIQEFIVTIGDDATTNLISNSVFYISIGSNDYIHYYLLNVSNVQSVYLPWSFNQFLAQTIKQEIKNLYNAKVRKVVVMGLAPIGCAPYYLWLYSSKNGECVETINDMILEFNFAVRYMVSELNEELVDASVIFCDAFEGSMDIIQNHDRYGFNVTDEACCGLGEYKGWIMCVSPDMACNNASSHIWWDQFHPTDAVNGILADNVWFSLHTPMCYPMNLQDMLAQSTR